MCHSCGSSFGTNGGLETNLRTYTGKTYFQCDMGGLCLAQHSASKTHFRNRTGEKPFMGFEWITLCTKFQFKNTFAHTGEKLFKCYSCVHYIYAKLHLKTHLLTHTREKPLKCDMCGLHFTLKPK